MKKSILFCLMMFLLGCESQKTCPVCQGEGSVVVYSEEQACLSCEGDGKLSEGEYEVVCNMLERLRQADTNAGELYSNEEAMATCPFCNGSGTSGGGICGFCQGAGQVVPSMATMGGHVVGGGSVNDFYPSSSSSNDGGMDDNSSNSSCRYCHGTGDCQHCKGVGLVTYDGEYNTEGGVMECPICKGTKRCNVCHGSGGF